MDSSAGWMRLVLVRTLVYTSLFHSNVEALVNNTYSCRMITFLQINTMSMLRSRFKAITRAFGKNLVPRHGSQSKMSEHDVLVCASKMLAILFCNTILWFAPYLIFFCVNSSHQDGKTNHNHEFSGSWNEFIISLREEDLVSHRCAFYFFLKEYVCIWCYSSNQPTHPFTQSSISNIAFELFPGRESYFLSHHLWLWVTPLFFSGLLSFLLVRYATETML